MKYQERFKSIFNGVIDILSLIDMEYNIKMVNKAYEHLLHKDSEECIGEKCYKIIQNREAPCEDCPILYDTNKPCTDKELKVCIGNETVSLTWYPVYDNKGKIIGLFEFGRVITKELKMEQELQHQGRLKMMGELAAAIVHEIKNPLVSIGLMSVSIMERLEKRERKDEIYQDIKGIFKEVKRLEKLLGSLMDFGKPMLFITKREDVHYPINESIKLLKGKFRANGITVKKEFDLNIPRISIDVSKIQQVMLNILLNSIDAMPKGGQITLQTSFISDQKTERRFVEIMIQDTGTGIKKEHLPYIFDPFYSKSLQSSYRTGLGLSIVESIIELHHGKIKVQSKEGEGTTIRIYLPVD